MGRSNGINEGDSEHIYMIPKASIESFGGEAGFYDDTDGRIDSILFNQFPIFGQEKYPNIFQKAAMLLYFFTKGHCFVDRNKRVGIQRAIVFLTMNGYIDNLADDEVIKKPWRLLPRKYLKPTVTLTLMN